MRREGTDTIGPRARAFYRTKYRRCLALVATVARYRCLVVAALAASRPASPTAERRSWRTSRLPSAKQEKDVVPSEPALIHAEEILTRARLGWCRMRPINGRQIGLWRDTGP